MTDAQVAAVSVGLGSGPQPWHLWDSCSFIGEGGYHAESICSAFNVHIEMLALGMHSTKDLQLLGDFVTRLPTSAYPWTLLCLPWPLILDTHMQIATRRMTIANGMCVSFCNQPKAHFGHPGTIMVNVTWMNRIQSLSNLSQHVAIYLQPFHSTCKFKSSPFFAHFGLPWVCPWDNRGKCYMDGKRIQCNFYVRQLCWST